MVGSDAMGEWVPLMDYAMKTGISLSTLRRHIKANKIRYKLEDGRYLLEYRGGADRGLPPQPQAQPPKQKQPASQAAVAQPTPQSSDSALVAQLQARVSRMSQELKKAHEEIAELKTLIAFYEETMGMGGNLSG